jgi:glycosyltransferase involved in cell wall biosynthesis
MSKIIIYHSNHNKLGGVETFVKMFCKRLSKYHDITFMYNKGDENDMTEIKQFVKVEKFTGQFLSCDILVLGSAWGQPITEHVAAEIVIQVIHANLENYAISGAFRLIPDKHANYYVSVSNDVAGALKRLHNIDSIVIYNLIEDVPQFPKKKNKVLKLITVSRLSPEKGIQRCIDFAKLMPYPYEWKIYGSGEVKPDTTGTNIKFMGYKPQPYKEIAEADYLVQLSETEGYCYSINEALQQKTPVLLTPFPSGFEQIEDGINGYRIPFDLKNIDFDKIKKVPKLKKFIEKSTEKDWNDLFLLTLSNIKYRKIEITGQNVTFEIGKIVEVSERRAKLAIQNGVAKYVN